MREVYGCGMRKDKGKYGDSGFARMTTWGGNDKQKCKGKGNDGDSELRSE